MEKEELVRGLLVRLERAEKEIMEIRSFLEAENSEVIDWDLIPKEYWYVSCDGVGDWFMYTDEPIIGLNVWLHTKGSDYDNVPAGVNITISTGDWKQSLRKRPLCNIINNYT